MTFATYVTIVQEQLDLFVKKYNHKFIVSSNKAIYQRILLYNTVKC